MRKRTLLTLVIVVAVGAGVMPGAQAGIPGVGIDDNVFTPSSVSGVAGDTLTWEWLTPARQHNVRQNKTLFRSGSPTSEDGMTFTRVFSAGTFAYYCEVHGGPGSGMDGTVKVRPTVAEAPAGLPFTVTWASPSSNTGAAFDVEYRVGTSGDWLPWKTDTTELSDVFGDASDPVTVQSGVTYQVRVRSQKSVTATGKTSKFSPKVSFTPSA